MGTAVTGPVYTRNDVRVTFHTFTWDDLQSSASEITASVKKVEEESLISIENWQAKTPEEGSAFWEEVAGEYLFLLPTVGFSAGDYYVIFEGEIDGSGFYEPVAFSLKTLSSEV